MCSSQLRMLLNEKEKLEVLCPAPLVLTSHLILITVLRFISIELIHRFAWAKSWSLGDGPETASPCSLLDAAGYHLVEHTRHLLDVLG